MEGNPYNLIAFQEEVYTQNAALTISPAPDTLLRGFMAWQGLEAPVEVRPQTLTPTPRTGFTVVEWGGAEVGCTLLRPPDGCATLGETMTIRRVSHARVCLSVPGPGRLGGEGGPPPHRGGRGHPPPAGGPLHIGRPQRGHKLPG